MDELLDSFSDEFLTNTFAVAIIDGEGDDDRRVARVLVTLTNAINNALRMCGKPVPDDHFRTEEDFIPKTRKQRKPPVKTWSSVANTLGFK